MNSIDLRSDTVTVPDAAMRRAIAQAEVGDDVLGHDPTAVRLQERVAALLGKEAALFTPSGTMANQIALRIQTRLGDQILVDSESHIYHYEQGGPTALSGLVMTCVPSDGGVMRAERAEAALFPDDDHFARPSLICLEDTHNRAGGRVQPRAAVLEVAALARERGLKLHLDGARLWNAHVASGRPLDELAAPFDTVSVCFSKALGAPVGSCLAGDAETIRAARRARKLFGGGMRQVGVLTAACLHALDHNLPRLAEDHALARRLAEGLDNPHVTLDHPVETNIVILRVRDEARLLAHLEERGILGVGFGPGRARLMPNLMVDPDGIETVLEALNAYREAAE